MYRQRRLGNAPFLKLVQQHRTGMNSNSMSHYSTIPPYGYDSHRGCLGLPVVCSTVGATEPDSFASARGLPGPNWLAHQNSPGLALPPTWPGRPRPPVWLRADHASPCARNLALPSVLIATSRSPVARPPRPEPSPLAISLPSTPDPHPTGRRPTTPLPGLSRPDLACPMELCRLASPDIQKAARGSSASVLPSRSQRLNRKPPGRLRPDGFPPRNPRDNSKHHGGKPEGNGDMPDRMAAGHSSSYPES
jgi:hypothetical protein